MINPMKSMKPKSETKKMMNILAVSLLLLTTLTTHGVMWISPPSPVPHPVVAPEHDQELADSGKLGAYPVVVVEYERDVDGGVIVTRISNFKNDIPDDEGETKRADLLSSPKELVCDSFGKCKHKFSNVLFKAKEKVSETVHDTKGNVEETADKLKHIITDTVSTKTEDMKEAIKHTTDKAKEIITEDIPEKAYRTKQTVGSLEEAVSSAVVNKAEDIKEASEMAKETAEEELVHIFRRGKAVLFDLMAYTFSPWAFKSLVGLLYLLGYATAYGMTVWVTFVSSHVLASSLSRQQFGILQSKIYPVYFRALGLSIGLSLLGQLKSRLSSRADMFQAYTLSTALLMTLVNLWYLEPKATKVMFERMKMEREEIEGRRKVQETGKVVGVSPAPAEEGEKEDGRERKRVEASERLKKLNTYSSLLNVLTLMALTSHLVYLSQRLCLVM